MKSTKKIVLLSVLVSLGLIISYIEAQIPPMVAIPGVKLGIANTVSVFSLYLLDAPSALAVSLLRVALSSLLFGSPLSLLYSTAGALLSLLVMVLAKRLLRFSPIGVSALGGVFHNLGQTLAAAIVLETLGVFFYFPALVISGALAGMVVGTLSGILTKRISDILKKM